jgi:hypothetical protein
MGIYLGEINEATTARYTATMYDETDAVIDGTALNTLTLTLYEKRTRNIIGSRNGQNVLNTNGVAVTATGGLTWTVAKADTAIVGNGKIERHVGVFVGTWAAGAKQFVHEVEMDVVNVTRVG